MFGIIEALSNRLRYAQTEKQFVIIGTSKTYNPYNINSMLPGYSTDYFLSYLM